MLKTLKKKTPTFKAIAIQGVKTKTGYKFLTPDEDINAFAKYIQMDWSWDAKNGEIKFYLPGFRDVGRPVYSVMIGYYVVSDGTPNAIRIYDKEGIERVFERVD